MSDTAAVMMPAWSAEQAAIARERERCTVLAQDMLKVVIDHYGTLPNHVHDFLMAKLKEIRKGWPS